MRGSCLVGPAERLIERGVKGFDVEIDSESGKIGLATVEGIGIMRTPRQRR